MASVWTFSKISLFIFSFFFLHEIPPILGLKSAAICNPRSFQFRSQADDKGNASTIKLLLVDDEPPLRKAVQTYLSQRGYDVESMESGIQALSYLNDPLKSLPHLIISDVNMPGMDGFQFLQRLKSFPSLRNIPVILLTARGMTQDRITGYRAGANAYLPKPFDPEELVSIIDNLVLNRQGMTHEMSELKRELRDIKSLLTKSIRNGSSLSASESGVSEEPKLSGASNQSTLTAKEMNVLELLCRGFTNKEIAADLDTSIRNIEKRITKMLEKTGTSNRTELVKYALISGLYKR